MTASAASEAAASRSSWASRLAARRGPLRAIDSAPLLCRDTGRTPLVSAPPKLPDMPGMLYTADPIDMRPLSCASGAG